MTKSTTKKSAPAKRAAVKKAAPESAPKTRAPRVKQAAQVHTDPGPIEDEDLLPTDEAIANVAALIEQNASGAGASGEPITSPDDGDVDAPAPDPVEGNDDDPDVIDAIVDVVVEQARAPHIGEQTMVGAPVLTDASASHASQTFVHTRKDGATISFDKVTVSKGERERAIAAFDAELD